MGLRGPLVLNGLLGDVLLCPRCRLSDVQRLSVQGLRTLVSSDHLVSNQYDHPVQAHAAQRAECCSHLQYLPLYIMQFSGRLIAGCFMSFVGPHFALRDMGLAHPSN